MTISSSFPFFSSTFKMISHSFTLTEQGEKSTALSVYKIKLPKSIEKSYLYFKYIGTHWIDFIVIIIYTGH